MVPDPMSTSGCRPAAFPWEPAALRDSASVWPIAASAGRLKGLTGRLKGLKSTDAGNRHAAA